MKDGESARRGTPSTSAREIEESILIMWPRYKTDKKSPSADLAPGSARLVGIAPNLMRLVSAFLAFSPKKLFDMESYLRENKVRIPTYVLPFVKEHERARGGQLCSFLNHCAGRGCSKEDCQRVHACMLCGGLGHGCEQTDPHSGDFICPERSLLATDCIRIGLLPTQTNITKLVYRVLRDRGRLYDPL